MRRPRYKLQVSTFPFLAVLLCAMGSLLLFLFIMDRRAKIAAQHMNDEVLEARKKRTKDEEDKLQAEWEQAKAKLHQALLLQQGELDSKAKGLQLDLTEADGKLKLIQTHYLDLKDKVKDEAAKVAEIQLQIAGRRKGLLAAEKKETMSKKELIAAAAELAELEIAFQQLVSMKEREKQVHSLVPYHGKRGDARKPIYVECLGPGVVFHPNDRALVGYDFDAEAVREEVERRVGKLTVRKASDDKQPNKAKSDAYVLFLVRPNGITSYYRAQSALKGYRIDFGYELIDQDWELDFGGKSFAKNLPIAPLRKPNEISADSRPTFEPKSPFIAINQGGSNGSQGANGPPREKGIGFGSGTSGSGISSGPGPIAPPGGVGPILPGSTGPGPIALPSPGSNVGPGLASGSNVGAGSIGLPAPGSNVGPGLASGSNVGAGSIGLPAPGSNVGPGLASGS
ncbi:MAG TPA: hypothetical protein VFE62_26675, partial [Gemmataceae bacterium]|nr:hypothetical protein [Gemmataceae bacterium]